MSRDYFAERLVWALPATMAVSFLVALPILWSLFLRETLAKLAFVSVLIAEFACAVPILATARHASERNYLEWGEEVAGQSVLPAVLLLILGLVGLVRRSRTGGTSYKVEALTALGIGICLIAWTYLSAGEWAPDDFG